MTPLQRALVSTIIPVRNRAALLTEAVNSVLAQTYRPIEILIIDDSIDATKDVARAFAAAHPGTITVLAQDGRGIGAARNIGLRAATGEFVQFLDSDDLLMPDKFARQVTAPRADPQRAPRRRPAPAAVPRRRRRRGRWRGAG